MRIRDFVRQSFFIMSCGVVLAGCATTSLQSLTPDSIEADARLAGGGLANTLSGNSAITTSFDDVDNQIVLPDTFEPKTFKPLFLAPRGAKGGYLLWPGAYEANVESFCLHAGTHGPSSGDGYLYAPLKGPKAGLILALLRGAAAHPSASQESIQLLIWAIEAHTKFRDLPSGLQQTALTLLTPQEILELDGGALGLIPQSVLDRAIESLPPSEREIIQVQSNIRNQLSSAESTFADIERLAVIPGVADPDGPNVPRGRWSPHPGGFFVRYLPQGYQRTRIEIYVPTTHAVGTNFHPSRIGTMHVAYGDGSPAIEPPEYDPAGDVAVPANTGSQRLGMSASDTQPPNTPMPTNSLHHKVSVPCPGSRDNAITIANATQAAYGIEHIVNSGTCSLSLLAVDKNGHSLPPSPGDHTSTIILKPGQSLAKWVPPTGTAKIIVACFSDCSGQGSIDYDDTVGNS
jgi:hypothetical protein